MSRAPDPSEPGASARALHLSLQAAQALENLPHRLHPGWLAALEMAPAALARAGVAWLNDLLQLRFDLRWPDLSQAEQALEMAWLLPPDDIRRLCAARALYADRGALARSVDAAERRRARQLVGSAAFDVLMSQPIRHAGPRRLPTLEPDAVVVAGWALLAPRLPWRDTRARRLAELILPPAAARARSACAKAGPPASGTHDIAGDSGPEHHAFAASLLHLFPEHPWLYGSEPASLKSA